MTIEQTKTAQIGDYNAAEVARYLGLNPNNPADQAMVAVCRRYDLDPVLKHVIVIPKGGVYVTRDGLLHIAHRSGQLDGIVVDQDPTIVDGEWVARVSVYRKDMGHPFTYPGRYSVNGGNKQYAQEMALKAAEAHALRRAFAVTGIPAFDEQRPESPVQPAGQRATAADRVREAIANAPKTGDAEGSQAETSVAEGAAGSNPAGNPSASSEPDGVTSAQLKKIGAAMRDVGLTEREPALTYVARVIGREVNSRNDLSKDEASRVIDALERHLAEPAPAAEVVDGEIVGDGPDPDDLWNQIMASATAQGIDVTDDFSARMGGLIPDDASADDLRRYLTLLTEGVPA